MSTNIENTKWYSYTSSTQTMRTWARQIKAQEDIPAPFQAAFPPYEGAFPYVVFIPEEKVSKFQQQNAKLIAVFTDHFTLLEQLENKVKTLSSLFIDVFALEQGVILLKSWLSIKTRTGTFEIAYNTTNDFLFNPIIAIIRQQNTQLPDQDLQPDKIKFEPQACSKFDFLDKVNFKFMNYGRRCTQKHDSVLAVAYQPEQTLQDIQLFRKTLFRRYKTDFLITLTVKELILIQEDEVVRTNYSPAHGGIFTYIPRHYIEAVTFICQPEDSNCVMEITLPDMSKLTCELGKQSEGAAMLQALLGA